MRNSGNYFGWPASPFAAAVRGPRGTRGDTRFGAHGFRMFAALCLFLNIGIASVEKAHADDGKENLAPKIVQEMQCGSHKVVIPCGKPTQKEKDKDESDGSAGCYNNPIKVFDAKGRSKVVFEFGYPGSSAEAMVCGVGRHGQHYMEVLSQDCSGGGGCDNNYYLLGEDGSYIASKGMEPEEFPFDADARDYARFVAKNKIHFRHRPVAPVALIQCGSHRVVITCGPIKREEVTKYGADERACVHNKLQFIDSRGKVRISKYVNSGPIDGWHADFLECGRGAAGKYYVQVRYSMYDGLCPLCKIYGLFTESGKFMAHKPVDGDAEPSAAKRYDRLWKQRKIKLLN